MKNSQNWEQEKKKSKHRCTVEGALVSQEDKPFVELCDDDLLTIRMCNELQGGENDKDVNLLEVDQWSISL